MLQQCVKGAQQLDALMKRLHSSCMTTESVLVGTGCLHGHPMARSGSMYSIAQEACSVCR